MFTTVKCDAPYVYVLVNAFVLTSAMAIFGANLTLQESLSDVLRHQEFLRDELSEQVHAYEQMQLRMASDETRLQNLQSTLPVARGR